MMTKDEIALLHAATMHADWGTQMSRDMLRKCYAILEKYDMEARDNDDMHRM